ncbi:MAG: UDP-3-O-(3-hydroxymyristoyl)glucosamine N-acyltransferase [Flavobacteriales bacterium]|nr:UDP-3-O-(3-hydroxymyristoyl)glucosamine N-acyltransferase [Flavobacteriales bacterium]
MKNEFTAREIATLIGGTIEGNPDTIVTGLSKIEEGTPNTLSFMANPKYEQYIYSTNASIVLVNQSFVPEKPVLTTLIRVADAYQSFVSLLQTYNSKKEISSGVEQPSFIAEDAKLGKDLYLGAFAYIGSGAVIGDRCRIFPGVYIGANVVIGNDCTIYPGVKIYHHCVLGSRVIIHANTVIGSDGFGYARNSDKSYAKIAQTGNVLIEDDVEIGACTTVDAATLGSTIIKKGTKLDNQIQVGHNVEIGEHTVMAAQVGISGSTKIGKYCVLAGQVGLAGHLSIADDVIIGAQAGVTKSVTKDGVTILGSPAYEVSEMKKIFIATRRLPDLIKKIANLEAEIDQLRTKINGYSDTRHGTTTND